MGKKISGVMPKIVVMPPTVVNVSGVSRENVFLERAVSRDPDDDKNYSPESSGILDGIECVHSSVDYPGRCAYHTSEFCRDVCAFNKNRNGK